MPEPLFVRAQRKPAGLAMYDRTQRVERALALPVPGGRAEVRRLVSWFDTKYYAEVSEPGSTEKVIRRFLPREAVGGGISQFATTLFNAAFFAGLDIPEYQSHSIYITRYPYGREATLSYPAPDLESGAGSSTPNEPRSSASARTECGGASLARSTSITPSGSSSGAKLWENGAALARMTLLPIVVLFATQPEGDSALPVPGPLTSVCDETPGCTWKMK